ncbi:MULTISPECIES: 4Fe-4S dicluster domain-containing protein [Desulfitobacterium]|uniref:Fe-S-cluster-containing hydrogenase subunit n=1 Tax=Desulfitobacterium dehalogenans (strain ATCC 51507 / DSM 9161 / JW/IU-DC1) TaxID=756499 RepID=I4AAF4_DESDJ|nr:MULTISPECIES: 4Fe-4S dicluster domain-containing protein [Desulfitobacterium]AFM00939.1 Fe-S-cluster-containing hydrogenase subunit [Desulfitobacterium dehalogenans ATCC 51507]
MRKIYFQPQRCDGCLACEQVCREKHSKTQSLFNSKVEIPLAKPHIRLSGLDGRYSVSICQNCVHASCVEACMAGALRYSDEGNVIHDAEQCVGCYMCVMVCPFAAIAPQETTGKAGKCQLCLDEEQPPCVLACSRKALLFGTSAEYEEEIEGDLICIM